MASSGRRPVVMGEGEDQLYCEATPSLLLLITVSGVENCWRNESKGDHVWKVVMKALLLYVAFVLIGGLIATAVGYYVEIEFSPAASLVVFLTLFFANFVTSWIAVILVMDGTLADAQGRQAQLEIERLGSRGTDGRARSAG